MAEKETMTESELKNLQVYIGKRSKNQTDEQVINRITKLNKVTPLSQEQWHQLLIPSSNNGYLEILKFVLSHIETVTDVKKYMIHTVNGRDTNLDQDRIEILAEFLKYTGEDKQECLDETMFNAGWFGAAKIVKFLIENGANKDYKYNNGLSLCECAQRAEDLFNDPSLKEYLMTL